jgi:hypothetical protein
MRGKSMRMRFALALVAMMAVVATVLGSASTATASAPDVASQKQFSAKQVANAKMSTMDCNGVTYAHNGYSYGWGNNRNRVIFGFGSAGNIRAVKVYGDGISSARWSVGVISQSGAVVESSGTGVVFCVEVPGTTKGVVLKSRYNNGATARETIYF